MYKPFAPVIVFLEILPTDIIYNKIYKDCGQKKEFYGKKLHRVI